MLPKLSAGAAHERERDIKPGQNQVVANSWLVILYFYFLLAGLFVHVLLYFKHIKISAKHLTFSCQTALLKMYIKQKMSTF